MASRKLKVDIEVDSNQARRKIAEAVPDVSGASASSAKSLSDSQDRLARATDLSSQRMLSMTRAFSGMALGLAASYSARYFEKGSKPEMALGYAGSVLSGASAGAAMAAPAGPQAAAIGGLAGGLIGFFKEYLDRDKLKSDMSKDYEKAETSYTDAKEFERDLKSVVSPFNGESLSLKLATLSDAYARIGHEIDTCKGYIQEAIDKGLPEDAKEYREMLANLRAKQSAIYSAAESLYTSKKDDPVASRSAVTTLQKIGGGAPSVSAPSIGNIEVLMEKNGRTFAAINTLVKEIRDNLGMKGDKSWL